uniref:Uncharacterized protein n=1 Tax=Dunaliella tertiolecta TaxID=3047 RepID=A0A7S3QND2_DUNTE
MHIVKSLLQARSLHLLQTVHTLVGKLVEPCQQTKSWPHVKELCEIVRMACSWKPPKGEAGTTEVATIWSDVDKVLERQMTLASRDVGVNNIPITLHGHPQVLGGLCCSLAVLETLEPLMPPQRMEAYTPLLVRLLNKIVKEMTTAAQMQAQMQMQNAQARQSKPIPLSVGTAEGPEYGSLAWATAACMRLLAPRVLHNNDYRKAVLSAVVSLVVGMTVRFLDPALLLEVLKVVSRWLVDPYPGQTGQLSMKEGVLLCQRLGMLERMAAISDPGLRATFDSSFVQLVQKLCSAPQVPKELREDAFTKIERMFMVGLRANNPSVRRDFFALYDSYVPMALFDRLQFIIFNHDWEAMAQQFWLKHALDMIFAVLKDDEDLLLAFNTAQVPSLLPGTRQNTYSPPPHMQTKPPAASQQQSSQPSQQQQQQQQQQGGISGSSGWGAVADIASALPSSLLPASLEPEIAAPLPTNPAPQHLQTTANLPTHPRAANMRASNSIPGHRQLASGANNVPRRSTPGTAPLKAPPGLAMGGTAAATPANAPLVAWPKAAAAAAAGAPAMAQSLAPSSLHHPHPRGSTPMGGGVAAMGPGGRNALQGLSVGDGSGAAAGGAGVVGWPSSAAAAAAAAAAAGVGVGGAPRATNSTWTPYTLPGSGDVSSRVGGAQGWPRSSQR